MTGLLDTKTAAQILTVKPQTLELWRCRGEGPRFFKIGRSVRYSEKALAEFIEDSERRSTSDQGDGADQ